MSTDNKEKALQARVSPEFAKRFNTMAKARGKTTSELVREAVEKMMADAESDLEGLRAELHRKYIEEQKALGLIPDDEVPTPTDRHQSASG
ncbi:hypothetical protein A5662_18125 [Mycobacteriaceae bacterium 1482268.1]|nr:hypothetical protein A5662_18125 [Mycobacteriaceae bacterium 1482268.1]